MNIRPEVLGWIAKANRYPVEWSDQASAMQALDKAEQVRDLVRRQLGLSG